MPHNSAYLTRGWNDGWRLVKVNFKNSIRFAAKSRWQRRVWSRYDEVSGPVSIMFFRDAILALAALPFVYYLLVLFSATRFFAAGRRTKRPAFTPPVSILKPVRGLDPEAYENFASFCRQDYGERPDSYEIVFCLGSDDDPAMPAIERVIGDFPEREIRIVFAASGGAANDKVAKLVQLAAAARHEHLVLSDSDVRVRPDYLRSVIAPLGDARCGAVTCFYAPHGTGTLAERLHLIGMLSDFYAGILVAWQLDGVKFAFGTTTVTTKTRIAGFGGFTALENRPADDMLTGRLIDEQGYRVELLPYTVTTREDYPRLADLFPKRLRWMVVMRHMRPWGHFGLLFTHGVFWSLVAVLAHPTLTVATIYIGGYLAARAAIVWLIARWGLRQPLDAATLPLMVAWDALAFAIWVSSFFRNNLRWRQGAYCLRDGKLVPAPPD